ncbi:MAG: RNA polymerase sigma factor [Planctomycetota bacterium]
MDADRARHPGSSFLTTRWSVVLAAGRAPSPARQAALEDLARAYWFPLYAFARRRGIASDLAADRAQGFFALLLEREDLARADPARGRFRAFLLTSFQHHLADERERERAQKRGGGREPVSIDAREAEKRLAREPVDADTPESAFERAWVAELLARTLDRLRAEQAKIGRETLFDRLRPSLAAEDDAPRFGTIARELSMTENAVKVAAHRLRKRCGELLRDEIAATVADPGDPAAIEDEIRALFRPFERTV